jgi:hypothetical protein
MAEKNVKEKENNNVTRETLTRAEGDSRGDLKEQRSQEEKWPQSGQDEAETDNKASQVKREEVRKVATMVQRLKRSAEEQKQ